MAKINERRKRFESVYGLPYGFVEVHIFRASREIVWLLELHASWKLGHLQAIDPAALHICTPLLRRWYELNVSYKINQDLPSEEFRIDGIPRRDSRYNVRKTPRLYALHLLTEAQ